MSTTLKKREKLDTILVRITYFIALLLLIGLMIYAVRYFLHQGKYENTNDAQVAEYINPILSRTTGYVLEVRYADHQEVQKGDTLVVLDKNETVVHQLEAESALSAALAQLKVMQSNHNTSIDNATVSASKIDAAKARLSQQQKEYERYKKLYAGEAVTLQRFENIKTNLDVAQSEYKTVENTYKTSQSQIKDIGAQIAVAQAVIKQKEVALEQIKLDLTYTVITAPSDGLMGNKILQVGQLVQKGQTIAFIVDKDQGIWVTANFKETQIKNMHKGQAAKITVDAYPGEVFQGEIESLSPATGSQFSLLPQDNSTGNFVKITQRFPIKVKLTDKPEQLKKLRSGMNVEVDVQK